MNSGGSDHHHLLDYSYCRGSSHNEEECCGLEETTVQLSSLSTPEKLTSPEEYDEDDESITIPSLSSLLFSRKSAQRCRSRKRVKISGRVRLLLFSLCLLVHLIGIYVSYLPVSDRFSVFPTSLQEVRQLSEHLMARGDGATAAANRSLNVHFVALFVLVYLFAQAYCLPGTSLLSVLSGALFGTGWGTVITSILSTVGSMMTYYLTLLIGQKRIVRLLGRTITSRIDSMSNTIRKQTKLEMTLYLVSARLFPLTPGWLINLASPVLGVDMSIFVLSTLVGNLPMIWVTAQAGSLIHEMNSMSDLLEARTVTLLTGMSLLLICVPLLQKCERLQKWFKFE